MLHSVCTDRSLRVCLETIGLKNDPELVYDGRTDWKTPVRLWTLEVREDLRFDYGTPGFGAVFNVNIRYTTGLMWGVGSCKILS